MREQLPRDALHDRRARVVRLVHAVPEAEQPPRVVLVLGARERLGDVFDAADVDEHAQARLVGAAVGRAPQRRHARGDAGEGVGLRGARGADGAGGGVLFFFPVFFVCFSFSRFVRVLAEFEERLMQEKIRDGEIWGKNERKGRAGKKREREKEGKREGSKVKTKALLSSSSPARGLGAGSGSSRGRGRPPCRRRRAPRAWRTAVCIFC